MHVLPVQDDDRSSIDYYVSQGRHPLRPSGALNGARSWERIGRRVSIYGHRTCLPSRVRSVLDRTSGEPLKDVFLGRTCKARVSEKEAFKLLVGFESVSSAMSDVEVWVITTW